MIFAGPCLYAEPDDTSMVINTAKSLVGIADMFRCKIYGGGTRLDRYMPGVRTEGLNTLHYIDREILPTGTEIQSMDQYYYCKGLSFLWIGARNSQNYSLIEDVAGYPCPMLIKRGAAMTVDELIGIYDIARKRSFLDVYVVERGISDIDRQPLSRWSPDLKGCIRLKHERPDIFDKLVVDCSHSVGTKTYIEDLYAAFLAIGVKHFMFECTIDGKSKTDQNHMLSVGELLDIVGGTVHDGNGDEVYV